MRFKIDENLPSTAANLLREAGHDALTVIEQGHGGASDSVVADVLRVEGRALITLDTGFADIRSYPPSEFPGIIVIRPRRSEGGQVLRILKKVARTLEEERLDGLLWIVDAKRIRIRGEDQ